MSEDVMLKTKDRFVEFFNKSVCEMERGYILAMMTDCFDIQKLERETYDREHLYNNALEIRMFHENGERKWFRTSIADIEFQYRERNDIGLDKSEYWDEEQYLDIAEAKSNVNKGIACATKGGNYPLPIESYKDTKIIVRNYLSYENGTGQLAVSDWRLVGFR